jgi:hypothetical protein
MPKVTLEFESPSCTTLGVRSIVVTPGIMQWGEKVQWAAKNLVSLPDDGKALQQFVTATRSLGEEFSTQSNPSTVETHGSFGSIDGLPEGTRLAIHCDWMSHRLPWECVAIGESWLGVRFAIKRVVSDLQKPLHERSVQRTQDRDMTVFLGEGPGLVGTVSECNLAENWMRSLHRKLPGAGQVRSLVTSVPSPEGLLQSLGNSRFFHYAGHGRIDPLTKLRAFAPLDLDHGGLVTGNDVAHLHQVPEYVYLNGCGLAGHSGGLNTAGLELPQAFLRAGTRWLIGPTVRFLTYRYFELVRAYYRTLDAVSWGPAEAMRQARKSLAQGGKRYERELPLALSTIVYGPAMGWSLLEDENPIDINSVPDVLLHEMRVIDYPADCSQCGAEIQTKFGNYATDPASAALCRKCRTDSGATGSMYVSATKSTAKVDSAIAKPSTSMMSASNPFSEGESENSLAFRRKLADDAAQFSTYYCPDHNSEIACRVVRIAPERMDCNPDRPLLKAVSETDRWTAFLQILPIDRGQRSTPLATIVVRYEGAPLEKALDPEDLESILFEMEQDSEHAAGRDPQEHRFYVIVSNGGFSDLAWSWIENPGIAWRRNHRSWMIHHPESTRIAFCKQDRNAYSLETFFRSHSIDDQFSNIMEWLESKLPLQSSLSAHSIADKTGFSVSVIESAMRIFGRRHQLAMMESKDFGLCIEDSLVAKSCQPSMRAK